MNTEYKGYLIEITTDDHPDSPREFGNFGTMSITGGAFYFDTNDSDNNFSSTDELLAFLNVSEKGWEREYVYLPVYCYKHTGIAFATTPFSCEWDSGQVGYIYVTKARVRDEFSCTAITKKVLEKVYALLNSEVNTFSQYANGDVCMWSVDKLINGHELDDGHTCCGYYDEDQALKDAQEYIDERFKSDMEKANKVKAEKAEPGVVPASFRWKALGTALREIERIDKGNGVSAEEHIIVALHAEAMAEYNKIQTDHVPPTDTIDGTAQLNCTECGCTSIQSATLSEGHGSLLRQVSCDECGAKWDEHWKFNGITMVVKGDLS